jgi:putative transposase
MAAHIHIVATVPTSITLASFVGQVKGSSSHLAARLEDTGEEFAWQAEYGVISVSESHLPLVVYYVQNQQQHHADNHLNRTLESIE